MRMREMAVHLLTARLVDASGHPGPAAGIPEVPRGAKAAGLVHCMWNIEVSYDRRNYYDDYAPKLQKILGQAAVRKGPTRPHGQPPVEAAGFRRARGGRHARHVPDG